MVIMEYSLSWAVVQKGALQGFERNLGAKTPLEFRGLEFRV